MAQLDFQINVGGNAGEAVGSLKKQLREAQQEVAALSDKFGATSAEAVKAAKRAGELKDRIGDAKALTDAFNPDAKFKALTSSLSGVAGGFAAVQGSIGLFGGEAKNVEKALLKVQSAMALSQGLQAIGESVDSFKQLKAVVIDVGTKAFGSLRAAIISTGIGALVIALGLLIANFDSVKKYILNLFPALIKVGEFFTKITNAVTDFVGITSEAERQLEKLQKTTERGNESINQRIKVLQAQGGKEKEIYKESATLIENDLNVLRKTLSAKGELTEEEQKKFRELQNEKEVLRVSETKRIQEENRKQADENKKKNDEILKQNEEARQKQLEIEQKRRDEVKGVEQEIRQIRNQTALVGLSDKDKRLLELQQELDANLLKYKDNLDARQKAYILYDEGVKLANKLTIQEQEEEDKKNNQTFLDNLGKRASASIANVSAVKQEGQVVKATEEQKQQAYAMTGNAFGALSDLIGRQTAAGKSLAIGQALINTFLGVTEVLRNKTTIPEPFGTISKVASIATILASGLGAVRQIKSTQIAGAGGGGGSIPSISAIAPLQAQIPQAATTNLSSSTINALGNQAIKAYVVETDVTTNQQRVKAIQQRARFD
jgi:hypothetical protein